LTVSSDWALVLDGLEAGVAGLEAGDHGTVPAFTPPAGLGPVPPALTGRAERLLGRMAALEEALIRQRTEIVRELAAVTAAQVSGPAAGAVPRFLDTTA
jgi:hypothetical protein